MKIIYRSLLIVLLLLPMYVLNAQTLKSSYFMPGSDFRHQLNPAFMGERNYISIPGLGNFNVGVQGNIGMSNFLYKYDDPDNESNLTTFMSSTVDANEFLSNLKSTNKIEMNLDENILSFGFFGFGGFNTFEINLHSFTSMQLPYELFAAMKEGGTSTNASYMIRDMRIVSNNYGEVAIGHSQKINEHLTVGAKLKGLIGGAYADAHISQMDITTSADQWTIDANGTLDISAKGASFETEKEDKGNKIKDIDMDNPGINGWGLGVDLGGVYQLNDEFTFSAAVLNLGFINWKENINGSTLNDTYTFDGFDDIAVDDDENEDNDLEHQVDDLKDDLRDLTKFYDQGQTSEKRWLAATVNLGAEYKLPFYKNLAFGFLSTTRFDENYTWTEGRLSANINPTKWFGLSVNYAASSLTTSLGWMLNFHPGGLSLFIGSDRMITKVNSDYIPVNDLNANISFGLNIRFGKNKYLNLKKKKEVSTFQE